MKKKIWFLALLLCSVVSAFAGNERENGSMLIRVGNLYVK